VVTEQAPDTREQILTAARRCLLDVGFARLSTRSIAEKADVPLSQIHYHFGSKQQLVVALLDRENERLLERQARMYGQDLPLWKRWEQACDFLEEDLESGYVRVLHEMISAGWSDENVAERVRRDLRGWYDLLADVASSAAGRLAEASPFTAQEISALLANAFLGAEATILLGFSEGEIPSRSARRAVGELIRAAEEGTG
jgi:AcrR family transcriptional regulator